MRTFELACTNIRLEVRLCTNSLVELDRSIGLKLKLKLNFIVTYLQLNS